MNHSDYRSEEESIQRNLSRHLARIAQEIPKALPWRKLYQRRLARFYTGIFGLCCGVLMFSGALVSSGSFFPLLDDGMTPAPDFIQFPTYLLMATPGLLLVAFLIFYLWAGRLFAQKIAPPTSSEVTPQRVEMLRVHAPIEKAREMVQSLSIDSFSWPLIAASVLGPLGLHLLVFTAFGSLPVFDEWIALSILIVGHTHLLLISYSKNFVKLLQQKSKETQDFWWKTILKLTAWSVIPGLYIGAGLVLITAIVLVPTMFWSTQYLVRKEERLLLSLEYS